MASLVPYIFTGVAAGGAAAAGATVLTGAAATGIGAVVLLVGTGITLAVKSAWNREKTYTEFANKLSSDL